MGNPVKFLTLMRDRGKGFLEAFSISMDAHSNVNSVFDSTLVLHVSMYGDNHECYVHTPITEGKWNKVSIKFQHGIMSTMANGNKHQIAFEDTAGQDDTAVDFCDWWLGDDIDEDLEAKNESDDDGMESWEVGLMVAGIVLGGCCFLALLYFGARYCYYNKLEDAPSSEYVTADVKGGLAYSPRGSRFVESRGPAPKPPARVASNFKSQGLRPSNSSEIQTIQLTM